MYWDCHKLDSTFESTEKRKRWTPICFDGDKKFQLVEYIHFPNSLKVITDYLLLYTVRNCSEIFNSKFDNQKVRLL